MNQEPELSRLVEDARNGSREAFRTLYECYSSRIFNFLYRLLGTKHEAEDATQQTFLISLHRIGSLRNPQLFESWIYRIARNEVYQKYRRKQVDSLDDDDSRAFAEIAEDPRLHGQPEKILLNEELGEALQSALNSLPLKMREVFILAVIDDMSYQDISDIVGRSLLSVKKDIYRARMAAKERLSRYLGPGSKASGQKSGAS
ncbi:MAG: sigma-70 family RNA polymerase sigma factor [Acidobacteria bacterium]|nr:sigma-70 family RNA polymerase sigma factor [Acidobacteriota bacterium]